MTRTTIKSILAIMLLNSSYCAMAQHAGNATYDGTRMPYHVPAGVDLNLSPNPYSGSIAFGNILEASVMINVKATAFVAIFNATQYGKTISEADSMMSMRLTAFTENLVRRGIPQQQIFVDMVSMVPTYEYEVINKTFSKTLNEKPTGFEMKKNIHITFFEHSKANELVTIAAMSEIYDLVKVDYIIDNMDGIYAQLREEALLILASKKSVYEKSGVNIRMTNAGERFASVYPFERYAQYYAAKTGAAPYIVYQAKKNTAVNIQYNYADKNKTVYYEKVPEAQFDKVINPVVGEPVVQLYLSIKTQFTIYDPETEKEEKAYKNKQRSWEEREMEQKFEDRAISKKEGKKPKKDNL